MLENIHEMFAKSDGYYQRLIETEHPRITFQLLELKNFGLSDDLYIKMNARGKPLTPFENFKARLEQHLDELLPNEKRRLHGKQVPVKQYFSHRMDTAWADMFWAHRNPETNLYDQELMRLIKAVVLVNMDPNEEAASQNVGDLRASGASISFSKFFDLGCLNRRMLESLEAVLDHWSEIVPGDRTTENARVFDSQVAFYSAARREQSFPELVKFAAFCAFVRTHRNSWNPDSCDQWLRVISNLVENSDIERPSDFVDALRSLRQLEVHADRILEYLAEGSDVSAFNRQQVREERVKAALMLKGELWTKSILLAERHGYFRGQIEFLLKFSGILDHWLEHKSITWSVDAQKQAQILFSNYLETAEAVFDTGGLRLFEDNKWERALLAL